jgi:hypothetical protein
MYAAQVWHVGDMMDLVRNGELFCGVGRRPPEGYRTRDPFGPFGGTVSCGVGLWADPRFKGNRIGIVLSAYLRALCVLWHAADWHIGYWLPKVREHARRYFAYSESGVVSDGIFPPEGREVEIELGRICRDEALALLARQYWEWVGRG